MATFTFNKTTGIIEVAAPDTFVKAQEAFNLIRRWEAGDISGNPTGLNPGIAQMDLDRIIDNVSTGKLVFDAGLTQGIIFVIRPPWFLQYEARGGPEYVECGITEGAILSFDLAGAGPELDFNSPRFPFKATAYVSTSREKDSTPSIIVSGSGVTEQDKTDIISGVWNALTADHTLVGSFGKLVQKIFLFIKSLI